MLLDYMIKSTSRKQVLPLNEALPHIFIANFRLLSTGHQFHKFTELHVSRGWTFVRQYTRRITFVRQYTRRLTSRTIANVMFVQWIDTRACVSILATNQNIMLQTVVLLHISVEIFVGSYYLLLCVTFQATVLGLHSAYTFLFFLESLPSRLPVVLKCASIALMTDMP